MTTLDGSPMPQESIADIKARIDILDLARHHVALRRSGRDWWGRCPVHADRTPSFQVSSERQNFRCWGCGVHGDVVDLVAAIDGVGLPEALRRVRDLAGGTAPDPTALAARQARIAAAAAREARETARRTALAVDIVRQSVPLDQRSPELPLRYLTERRGIRQWQPWSLRWHPACPWGRERVGCIIAPVCDVAGDLTGCWRIRPSLEGPVERRGLGAVLGGCARVIDDAGISVLTIAEGVEDALSAWTLLSYPAWAALSTGGMAALQLPAQFEQLLICADADPAGREAARALARRMRDEGREVRVLQPQAGKDANDVLLSRRQAA